MALKCKQQQQIVFFIKVDIEKEELQLQYCNFIRVYELQ